MEKTNQMKNKKNENNFENQNFKTKSNIKIDISCYDFTRMD